MTGRLDDWGLEGLNDRMIDRSGDRGVKSLNHPITKLLNQLRMEEPWRS